MKNSVLQIFKLLICTFQHLYNIVSAFNLIFKDIFKNFQNIKISALFITLICILFAVLFYKIPYYDYSVLTTFLILCLPFSGYLQNINVCSFVINIGSIK